jgi:hypothetical protein
MYAPSRHSDTVSDVIEPPTCKDPGYGKLQVGIYVAAIQDMMDRTKQRLQRSQPKSHDGIILLAAAMRMMIGTLEAVTTAIKGITRAKQGGGRANPSSGVHMGSRFQGGTGRKDPGVDELVTIEVCLPQPCKRPGQPDHQHQKTIQAASKRDMLLLYLQYTCLVHSLSSSDYGESKVSSFSNECLSIVLTSEIGQGATGIVHRGTLKLNR